MTNCTLSGNKAGVVGGGIHLRVGTKATLTNCTLSGNEGGRRRRDRQLGRPHPDQLHAERKLGPLRRGIHQTMGGTTLYVASTIIAGNLQGGNCNLAPTVDLWSKGTTSMTMGLAFH